MTGVEAIITALADLTSEERAEVLRAFVIDTESLRLLQEHESLVAAVECERFAPVSSYAGFRL